MPLRRIAVKVAAGPRPPGHGGPAAALL